MKAKYLIGGASLLAIGAIAWGAKDPTVMTVNGVPVSKSEFEYLYHKNSQQQMEAQPLEEYIGMFELYKMKVEDAKSEGIDTTSTFRNEMEQYRRDLATPYITDTIFMNTFVDEAYQHSLDDVEAIHIMIAKGNTFAENSKAVALVDSLLGEVRNGANFEEIAARYSVDRGSSSNGGNMGYISANRYPYWFEHAAYSLKPGEISDVVESNVGYHILKGGNKRPAKGSVKASHIMKMVRPGASAEEEAAAKAAIDSLYLVVKANPESFAQVAVANSEDPGSARQGGELGWFVTGQMVPEFSDAAFAMEVGEISEPVRTQFGWHIIKKTDAKGPKSKAELAPELIKRMGDPRDERFSLIRDKRINTLLKKHKGKENSKNKAAMDAYVAKNGLDSAFYSTFGADTRVLYEIDGKPVTIAEFAKGLSFNQVPDPFIAEKMIAERYKQGLESDLIEAEEIWLDKNNPDYHNLLKEYKEGSLLYEVSVRKVWDKANQDTAGLERYFAEHKDDYTWERPKLKGFLVQAKSDSIADLVKARYAELGKDTAIQTLRKEFRNEAVFDKVLTSQGTNKIVDYLAFGGPEADPNPRFPVYFLLDARMVSAPEEAADVRGLVTADYQNQLEQEWVNYLRRRYPVVRNERELKKIK